LADVGSMNFEAIRLGDDGQARTADHERAAAFTWSNGIEERKPALAKLLRRSRRAAIGSRWPRRAWLADI
jgi:hypothetical protein